MATDLEGSPAHRSPQRRYWTIWDALGCIAIVLGTGFPVVLWWPATSFYGRVRSFPGPEMLPLFCVVVAMIAAVIMSPIGDRIPRSWSITAAIVVLVGFLRYDVPLAVRNEAALRAGRGSDNTNALEIGGWALMSLRDPYAIPSSLGNPISPMLGGIILGLPILLVSGTLVAQIPLYWIAGATLAERSVRHAAFVVCLVLVASPWIRAWIPTQNDHPGNTFVVVAASAWGWSLVSRGVRGWRWVLWIFLFACALDYRITHWAIAVPYFFLFWRSFGWSRAWRNLLPVALATLGLFALQFLLSPSFARNFLSMQLRTGEVRYENNGALSRFALFGIVVLLLVVCSWFVRGLSGVWWTCAAFFCTLIVGLSVISYGAEGFKAVFNGRLFRAYIGPVIVYGLAGLVVANGRTESGWRAFLGLRTKSGHAE